MIVMKNKIGWKREDILRLSLYRKLSLREQKYITEKYDSYSNFLQNPPEWFESKYNGIFKNDEITRIDFEDLLEKLEKEKIRYITYFDENYPELLREIYYAPMILYYKGQLSNGLNSIAIVGTRRNTLYGKITTEKIVEELVKNQIIVVSGLAYGIDSIAHRETLKNKGITYAIIASGIDEISPAISRDLANKIIDSGGAVISEYPPGTKARPGYFPQRNRIISGVSQAVIVVESDIKGGALITASFAIDQSRELFAVPGPINSSKSAGCNKLIHDSQATAVLSAESILLDLGLISSIRYKENREEILFDDKIQKIIYEEISSEPMHIDTIAEKVNIDVPTLLVKLLELEFKGLARQLPGKYFIKN